MALGRKPQKDDQQESRVVEISAEMQGSLNFKDPVNLKISGSFSGTLIIRGTLTIGNTAQVQANIEGDNIVIAGKVTGDVTAKKMLVLMPTANLEGNIKTPKLNIVEGALFHGHCQMRQEDTPDDLMLNIDEVSKYLEIDMTEIEELANSGKIPATKSGNSWKFERSIIDHWASSGKLEN